MDAFDLLLAEMPRFDRLLLIFIRTVLLRKENLFNTKEELQNGVIQAIANLDRVEIQVNTTADLYVEFEIA